MELDPNYIKILQKEFGEDADFILPIWLKVLDDDPTLASGEIKKPRDIPVGKCNEYDLILLHCISANIEGDKQARFIQIFLNRIFTRFSLPTETTIKICRDFEIVISN